MNVVRLPGLAEPLPLKSIIWLQGHGNYTWIYVEANKRYLASQTLKRFEEQLSQFVRIHKSVLLNPAYVRSIGRSSDKDTYVTLQNRTRLLVARRRIRLVKNQLPTLKQLY
jgi:DNA-binding LytR/AlgR family response regulator